MNSPWLILNLNHKTSELLLTLEEVPRISNLHASTTGASFDFFIMILKEKCRVAGGWGLAREWKSRPHCIEPDHKFGKFLFEFGLLFEVRLLMDCFDINPLKPLQCAGIDNESVSWTNFNI